MSARSTTEQRLFSLEKEINDAGAIAATTG